jgi:hypothetical protein
MEVAPSSGETILTPAISGLLSAEIKATTKFLNKSTGSIKRNTKLAHGEAFIINFQIIV